MLTKMVDGKEFVCSAEEERVIRMHWALNDQYPEYRGHLMFDGVNEPKHDLEPCKFYHRQLIESIIAKKIAVINLNIEAAEEAGDDATKKTLLQARKSIKDRINYEDSEWTTIVEIKAHLDLVKAL